MLDLLIDLAPGERRDAGVGHAIRGCPYRLDRNALREQATDTPVDQVVALALLKPPVWCRRSGWGRCRGRWTAEQREQPRGGLGEMVPVGFAVRPQVDPLGVWVDRRRDDDDSGAANVDLREQSDSIRGLASEEVVGPAPGKRLRC